MKILVPIDGTRHSLAAVDFVASRRALVGRDPDVHLLHAQWPAPRDVEMLLGVRRLRALLAQRVEPIFRPALRKLEAAELVTHRIEVVGYPGDEIAKAAKKQRVDLIVMASRGLSAARSFFLGSVTGAVLARTRTPLLIVRGRAAPQGESLLVGIGVDGSKYSAAAVRYVIKHRFLFGPRPEIRLVHVTPPFVPYPVDMGPPPLPPYAPADIEALQAQACDAAMRPARALLEKAGLAFEETRLSGDPGDVIAAFATSHRLDVLVMGSHGRGKFAAAILGSVAMRVVARSRIPVLLIRRE